MLRLAFVLLFVVMTHAPAHAQLHKCTGKDGRTTYSDTPCQATESAQTLAVPRADPPPRAAAPSASAGSGRPPLSPAAQAHEDKRQKLIAESRAADQQRTAEAKASKQRIEETAARVRQIKAENFDPQKCAAVQARMQGKTTRDPIGATYDPGMLELRGMRDLYCGP